MKYDVVFTNLIILGGSGGMLLHGKFFQPLRLFLVASGHSDGENLSVISTVMLVLYAMAATRIYCC